MPSSRRSAVKSNGAPGARAASRESASGSMCSRARWRRREPQARSTRARNASARATELVSMRKESQPTRRRPTSVYSPSGSAGSSGGRSSASAGPRRALLVAGHRRGAEQAPRPTVPVESAISACRMRGSCPRLSSSLRLVGDVHERAGRVEPIDRKRQDDRDHARPPARRRCRGPAASASGPAAAMRCRAIRSRPGRGPRRRCPASR